MENCKDGLLFTNLFRLPGYTKPEPVPFYWRVFTDTGVDMEICIGVNYSMEFYVR